MHQSENVMQCNCDSVPQTPFTRLTTQVEVPLSAACRSAAASFAPAGSWTTTAETCSWKGRAPNPLLLMLYDAIVYPRSLLQRAGQTFRKQWISRNDLLEISQYYKAPIARLLQFHTVPVSLPAVSLQVLLECDRAAPAALAAGVLASLRSLRPSLHDCPWSPASCISGKALGKLRHVESDNTWNDNVYRLS